MNREQFFNFIEVQKESMPADFTDDYLFVLIDLSQKKPLFCNQNSFPIKLTNYQWIICVCTYRWENAGYTNYSHKLIGMYDKELQPIDYIPFGFWLLKDIKFSCGFGQFFNAYCPVPYMVSRFNSDLNSKDYKWPQTYTLTDMDKFLSDVWNFEKENRNVAFEQ